MTINSALRPNNTQSCVSLLLKQWLNISLIKIPLFTLVGLMQVKFLMGLIIGHCLQNILILMVFLVGIWFNKYMYVTGIGVNEVKSI